MIARTSLNAAIAERDRIHAEIAAGHQRVAGLDGRAAEADARAEAERAAAAEADAVAMAEGRKPAPRKAEPGTDSAREAAASRRGPNWRGPKFLRRNARSPRQNGQSWILP